MARNFKIPNTDLHMFSRLSEDDQAFILASFSRTAAVIYLAGQENTYAQALTALNSLQGDVLRPKRLISTSSYIQHEYVELKKELDSGDLGTEEINKRFHRLDRILVRISETFNGKAGGSSLLGSTANLATIGEKQPALYFPSQTPTSKPSHTPSPVIWSNRSTASHAPAYMTEEWTVPLQTYLKTLKPQSLQILQDFCRSKVKFMKLPWEVQIGIGTELMLDPALKIATAASIKTEPDKAPEVETNYAKFQENYAALQAELAQSQKSKPGLGLGGR